MKLLLLFLALAALSQAGTLEAVSANVPGGVNITFGCDTAPCKYTDDGTDPSSSGTAVAYDDGFQKTYTSAGSFTIKLTSASAAVPSDLPFTVGAAVTTPTVTITPIFGGKNASLSCDTGLICRYTTDGSDPTVSAGVVYADGKVLGYKTVTSLTVKTIAYKDGSAASSSSAAVGVSLVATPSIAVAPIVGGKTATLTCPSGATCRYVDDGSTLNEATGTIYSTGSGDVIEYKTVTSKTVNTIAYQSGLASATSSGAIDVTAVAIPTISTSDIVGGKNVTAVCPSGATCRYNVGTPPSEIAGTVYPNGFGLPLTVVGTAPLNTIAYQSGFSSATSSLVVSVTAVAEPTVAVDDIVGGKKATLTCPTGATCRYVDDGSPPPTTSTGYVYSTGSGDVHEYTFPSHRTINTIAYQSGYASATSSAAVTVTAVATPTITITDIPGGKKATLTCPSGATCRYRDDNVAPMIGVGTVYWEGGHDVIEFKRIVSDLTIATIAYMNGNITSTSSVTISVTAVGYPSVNSVGIVGGKNVSLTCPAGATCRYFDNGASPTTSTGTEYSGENFVPYTTAGTYEIRIIAYKDGFVSNTDGGANVHVTAVATPTVAVTNIIGGKKATLTCPAGATCRYLDDGGTPGSTTGTTYSGPTTDVEYKTVTSKTVSTIAYQNGYVSSTSSGSISVTAVATPTVAVSDIIGGKQATLTCPASASCRYVDDGSTLNEATGTIYTGPTEIVEYKTVTSKTVQTIAYQAGYVSANSSGSISVTSVATPTVAVSDIVGGKKVTLTCPVGLNCRYRDTGVAPTEATGTPYSLGMGDVIEYKTATAKTVATIAYKSGNASATSSAAIDVTALPMPSITPTSVATGKNVSLTCPALATCRYTDDGTSTPSESVGTIYSNAFVIQMMTASTKTFMTSANQLGYASTTATLSVTVTSTAAGSITLANIAGGKQATLSCGGPQNCLYTVDGTDPSTSGADYIDGQTVTVTSTSPVTIKTLAQQPGMAPVQSSLTITVTAVATPTIAVSNIAGGKQATLTCPAGATCRFVDDSSPLASGSFYEDGYYTQILSDGTKTIKTLAFQSGFISTNNSVDVTVSAVSSPSVASTADIIGGKVITLSCPASASCRYRDDGTSPTITTGTIYANNTQVSYTTVSSLSIKMIAYANGYSAAPASSTLTVSEVSAPSVDVEDASGGKKVVFWCYGGATCRYTLNSAFAPNTTFGTVFAGDGSSSYTRKTVGTDTIKYTAYKAGYVSFSASTTVTLPAAATPTIPAATNIDGGKQYYLTCPSSFNCRYTVDGAAPTETTGTMYTSTTLNFLSAGTATIQTIAFINTGYVSASASAVVNVTASLSASVTVSPITGGKKAVLGCESGYTCRYTVDSTLAPNMTYGTLFSSLTLSYTAVSSHSFKTLSWTSGKAATSVAKTVSVTKMAAPTVSPGAAGVCTVFNKATTVTLSHPVSGTTIHYSSYDKGADKTTTGTVAPGSTMTFDTAGTYKLKAYAAALGFQDSDYSPIYCLVVVLVPSAPKAADVKSLVDNALDDLVAEKDDAAMVNLGKSLVTSSSATVRQTMLSDTLVALKGYGNTAAMETVAKGLVSGLQGQFSSSGTAKTPGQMLRDALAGANDTATLTAVRKALRESGSIATTTLTVAAGAKSVGAVQGLTLERLSTSAADGLATATLTVYDCFMVSSVKNGSCFSVEVNGKHGTWTSTGGKIKLSYAGKAGDKFCYRKADEFAPTFEQLPCSVKSTANGTVAVVELNTFSVFTTLPTGGKSDDSSSAWIWFVLAGCLLVGGGVAVYFFVIAPKMAEGKKGEKGEKKGMEMTGVVPRRGPENDAENPAVDANSIVLMDKLREAQPDSQ